MEEIKTEAKADINVNKEEKVNVRKERIKEWLKDRYNLTFLGILILAIAIRLYFFNLTKTQALWWDEADYLAYAKNLAGFDVSWIIAEKHNSFYPYLAAGIFKMGFGEAAAKFILQLIPSILAVVMVYFLANEMYKDKKVGLITAFLMSVFWVHLFDSTRFHIDIPALFFGLLSIYVFWKGYEKKEKIFGRIDAKWAIPLAAALVVLTYSIRRGYFLFGVFILFYVTLTKNWKLLAKDKYNWIGLVGGLILFFIIEKTIFISGIGSVGESYFHEELSINFFPLKVFESFFKFSSQWNIFLFYFFWIGLFLLIGKIALSFGHIRNNNYSVKSDLFNVLVIIITLAFFTYIIRNPDGFGEPRWYLSLAFSVFICIARAGTFVTDLIRPYNRHAATIVLVALVILSGYYQYNQADDLIKNKVNSYSGIRDASLFIKEVSNKDDQILTMGQPQVEYYAERKTIHARVSVNASSETEEHFFKTVDKLKEEKDIRYILISFSEPGYPLWMKRESYTSDGRLAAWEIPFMETKIDFLTGEQQINQEGKYDDLTFKLVGIKEEVFIYEIARSNSPP